MTQPSPKRYSQVRISADLHRRFKEKADERSHPLSFLARTAIATAARLAADEKTKSLLPRTGKSDGKLKNVQWAETREDAAEMVKLIEAAGSSRPAVLTAFAESYLRADGSLVRMDWPFPGSVGTIAA